MASGALRQRLRSHAGASTSHAQAPGRVQAPRRLAPCASFHAETVTPADIDAFMPAAIGKRQRVIRMQRPGRQLDWVAWEESVYQRYVARLQAAEEEGGGAGGGGIDWNWYHSAWDGPAPHQALLEDQVRISAWQSAIAAAAPLLRDKVVLDVGCGYGLLSMLAAEAGARHVYGVDASAAADTAAKVVAGNGMGGRITIVRGRVEDVTLPVHKVDVIISDWMGPCLVHDSLLPALLRARDRWLAPGGLLLPDRATLQVMGVDDRDHTARAKKFWSRPHGGFDFSAALGGVVRLPRQDTLARDGQALTEAQPVLELDLYTARLQDCLAWRKPFQLTAQREGRVSALLAYFDAEFTCRGKLPDAPVLTTHPMEPATGWLQTLFSFPRAIPMAKGEVLAGSMACAPLAREQAAASGAPAPLAPPGQMLDADVEVSFKGAVARVGYQLRRPVAIL